MAAKAGCGSNRRAARMAVAGLMVFAWTAMAKEAPPQPAMEPAITFYIDDVEFLDLVGMARILQRNGAAFSVVNVPFGRATHLLDTNAPGCGFILARDLAGRSDFRWLAPTLKGDLVIATSDPAHPEPAPGDSVASYGAQGILNLLAEYGFQPVLYRSMAQAAKLLETGRVRFIVGIEPTLVPVGKILGRPLTPVKKLHPVDTWLGCNAATPAAAATIIERAWKDGLKSGEIQELYRSAGVLPYFPPQ